MNTPVIFRLGQPENKTNHDVKLTIKHPCCPAVTVMPYDLILVRSARAQSEFLGAARLALGTV